VTALLVVAGFIESLGQARIDLLGQQIVGQGSRMIVKLANSSRSARLLATSGPRPERRGPVPGAVR
jgi:hypothetical protein